MKVLAMEASCPPGSIALLEETEVIRSQTLKDARHTTAAFASVIDRLLTAAGWSPRALDLVATCNGPGSFTGIRIGVTATKVLAYACHAKAIGINTLELIAHQANVDGEIEVVLDALRGDLFAARFEKHENHLNVLIPAKIINSNQWLQRVQGAALTGTGLTRIADQLDPTARIVDAACWRPQASLLGALATGKVEAGAEADPWKLVPHYLRRSAAEEAVDAKVHRQK